MYVKEATGKFQPGVDRKLFKDGDTIIVHIDADPQERLDVFREIKADGLSTRYCRADGHWWDVYEVYADPVEQAIRRAQLGKKAQ